jgi:hypothetical protein
MFGSQALEIAMSLALLYWFDVLNKLVDIRSVGKQPERAQQEANPAVK